MKIISGGQTGVDRAALDAALDVSIPCGGYCPLGRKSEDGFIPLRYPLQSLSSASYKERTLQNVLQADATLIFFSDRLTGGTRLTVDLCRKHRKPVLAIDAATQDWQQAVESSLEFMMDYRIGTVNVAGPRHSQWPDGYRFAYDVLHAVLQRFSRTME